jgi:hypothetical protein
MNQYADNVNEIARKDSRDINFKQGSSQVKGDSFLPPKE